jgi:transcriptional regulator with GAF, ATPase, and Fis domain
MMEPVAACPVEVLLGDSPAFCDVEARIDDVAATDATVLLLGETGTGKGLVARAIHQRSRRRAARFVHVNCAALPRTLAESELFGHERGAFTDANATQAGRFELAHGGTIFLDEVGELPLSIQSKLLRVLQEGRFERLGSPRTQHTDVRVIAATNRQILNDVRRGRFRQDLFYRLNVVPITLPPLRERLGDIPLLARHILKQLGRKYNPEFSLIPPEIIEQLEAYDWPGNVRELENVLERAVIGSRRGVLALAEPLKRTPTEGVPAATGSLKLRDVERAHLMHVLALSGWRIDGARGAAAALGLKPSTLRSRLAKAGLGRPTRASGLPGPPAPSRISRFPRLEPVAVQS